LVPYFCKNIADGVVQHLGNLVVLHRFLLLTRALLANPDVHLAPYLQQLLPAVVTCVVTQSLGESCGLLFDWRAACIGARSHCVCAAWLIRVALPKTQHQACRLTCSSWSLLQADCCRSEP
jgi:hypothetical protein